MKTFLRVTLLVPVLLVLWVSTASAATLIIQLRTTYKPKFDFWSVKIAITKDGSSDRFDRTHITQRRNYEKGIRVAEMNLDDGTYRGTISLYDGVGERIIQRPFRVNVKGVRVITVLMTPPPPGKNLCFYRYQTERLKCRGYYGRCKETAKGDNAAVARCEKQRLRCEERVRKERVTCDKRKRQQKKAKGKAPSKGSIENRGPKKGGPGLNR